MMNQVSRYLRRATRGYVHWCPACKRPHMIFDNWTFDNNLEKPTFTPSVKITGKQSVVDETGKWIGEYIRNPDGSPKDNCCHYNLTAGVLFFHNDCTHEFRGDVPLPELPEHMCDIE